MLIYIFHQAVFLNFAAKGEIYDKFKSSILTELTKLNYNIKQKPDLPNAYRINTIIVGNNTSDF